MNSAKKQTKQRDMTMRKEIMPLRIVGAHVEATAEALPNRTITERDKLFVRARIGDNGGITVIKNFYSNGSALVLTDHSTKQQFLMPDLIGIWEIRAGSHFDIPFDPEAHFPYHRWMRIRNEHPSKRHMYDKHRDVWRVSNPSWVEMDRPPMLRGIDLQHPELW